MRAWAIGLFLSTAAGCMPPSVETVDEWLMAYATGDVDGMVRHTVRADRDLVRRAAQEKLRVPTSTLAMLMPPRPVSYEILEIEGKERGRHTILTKVRMKNPLAYSSERVGQPLPDVPKTRTERRRFLSVKEGDVWGVKLDLERALARMEFAAAFQRKIAAGRLDEAAAMLSDVPPPPDEANALRKKDRLKEVLQSEVAEARERRSKAKETGTSTAGVNVKRATR